MVGHLGGKSISTAFMHITISCTSTLYKPSRSNCNSVTVYSSARDLLEIDIENGSG